MEYVKRVQEYFIYQDGDYFDVHDISGTRPLELRGKGPWDTIEAAERDIIDATEDDEGYRVAHERTIALEEGRDRIVEGEELELRLKELGCR